MKLTAQLFFFWCCLCNWLADAYRPIASMFDPKKIASGTTGFYKSLSGMFSSSSNMKGLQPSRPPSDLNMIGQEQMLKQQSISQKPQQWLAWWPLNFAPSTIEVPAGAVPKKSSKLQAQQQMHYYQATHHQHYDSIGLPISQSSLLLQFAELERLEKVAKETSHTYDADVAGFMEFDPKAAARNARKRATGKRSNRQWFRL